MGPEDEHMTSTASVDVLVVGAGPTGLTLAGECLRHGLTVRIIDMASAPCDQSRAIAVHARTLEIFDDLGIGDRLIDRGKKLVGATLWAGGPEPIARVDFDSLPSRHRYVLSIAQAQTEEVLGELCAQRGAEVERSTELLSFRQDGTGVTAKLKGPAGESTCRAAWLVGCDGAHSVVRKGMGVSFEGETYDEKLFLADVKIAWDVRDDRISTWFGDDGLVACFPLPEGRWRVVGTIPAGDERTEPPSLETIQTMVRMLSGTPAVVTDPVWLVALQGPLPSGGALPRRPGLSRGRRRPHPQPCGGPGDEHRHPGRAQPRVEARAGAPRRRAGRAARHLRRRAPRGGQSVLRCTDAATKVGVVKMRAGPRAPRPGGALAHELRGVQHQGRRVARRAHRRLRARAPLHEHTTGLLQGSPRHGGGGRDPHGGVGARVLRRGRRGRASAPPTGASPSLARRAPAPPRDPRRPPKHVVLLFDGRSDSADGYARFAAIAAAVRHALRRAST
jgi:hypothetical protein